MLAAALAPAARVLVPVGAEAAEVVPAEEAPVDAAVVVSASVVLAADYDSQAKEESVSSRGNRTAKQGLGGRSNLLFLLVQGLSRDRQKCRLCTG